MTTSLNAILAITAIMLSGCFALPVQNYKASETNSILLQQNEILSECKSEQAFQFKALCAQTDVSYAELRLHSIELLRTANHDEKYAIFVVLKKYEETRNNHKDDKFLVLLFGSNYQEFNNRYSEHN